MDDDGSRKHEITEFTKAMQDYRISTDINEINRIFKIFDRDGSNTVDYEKFLRTIVGEMNDRRHNLVA